MSDPTKQRRSGRVEMALPLRLRGLSSETKFFDELAETMLISKNGFMTRIRAHVDLETEVLVTSLSNNRTGTFRAAWIRDSDCDGLYNLGLELIEGEEDLWGVHFPAPEGGEDEVAAKVWLVCRRCRQKLLTAVPEAEYGSLTEGFLIARNCVRCKATTTWEFTEKVALKPAGETGEPAISPPPSGAPAQNAADQDLRKKGRAPLQMRIKVTRHKHGIEIEDVCETLNVSRDGALFLTSQHYDAGEPVRVVMPYREGEMAIPVPARVVRTGVAKNSFLRAVAVNLEKELRGERGASAPSDRKG